MKCFEWKKRSLKPAKRKNKNRCKSYKRIWQNQLCEILLMLEIHCDANVRNKGTANGG